MDLDDAVLKLEACGLKALSERSRESIFGGSEGSFPPPGPYTEDGYKIENPFRIQKEDNIWLVVRFLAQIVIICDISTDLEEVVDAVCAMYELERSIINPHALMEAFFHLHSNSFFTDFQAGKIDILPIKTEKYYGYPYKEAYPYEFVVENWQAFDPEQAMHLSLKEGIWILEMPAKVAKFNDLETAIDFIISSHDSTIMRSNKVLPR